MVLSGVSEMPLLVIMAILLISTSNFSYASGTMSPNINSSTIAYQHPELEFLMDSETSRRVLGAIRFSTTASRNPNRAAFCGRGRYRSCTGPPSNGPPKDTCATYKRNCPINR